MKFKSWTDSNPGLLKLTHLLRKLQSNPHLSTIQKNKTSNLKKKSQQTKLNLLRKLQCNSHQQPLTHYLKFQNFLWSKLLRSQHLSTIQKNKTSNLKKRSQQTKLNRMNMRYKSLAIYLCPSFSNR